MKRKRPSDSPKKGVQFPSDKLESASSFLNKKSTIIPQSDDFQNTANQLIQVFGIIIEQHIRRNPITFSVVNHPQELITPPIIILNSIQELNLREDINYKIYKQIGCLKPEIINEIHSAFHNNGLTGTKSENFIPHFIGGITKARKIIWLRNDNLLTFTFEHLKGKLFPYYDNPFEILAEHFCDSEGNDYTAERLRKSHSKGVRNMEKLDMIRNVFSSLLKK